MVLVHLRALSCVVAVALLFGVSACGDSSDDDGDGGGVAASSTTTAATNSATQLGEGSSKQSFQELVDGMQAAIDASDGKLFCSVFTTKGQREIVATGFSKKKTCAAVATDLGRRSAAQGVTQKPVEVLSVAVDGDIARVRVTDQDRPPVLMRFVREDGRWKLPTIAGPSGA